MRTKQSPTGALISKCFLLLLIGWKALLASANVNLPTNSFSPEEYVQRELEIFEMERHAFLRSESHGRSKRTVMFNSLAPIDLGLLLGIPLSVALPSLSNFFHFKEEVKVKRSADEEAYEEPYEENPVLEPHVQRISMYFELINIPEKACQERAICEFSADPSKFYPISELILSRLRHPSTVPLMGILPEYNDAGENETSSRKSPFIRYTAASDLGVTNGPKACEQRFSGQCPHETKERLNNQVLAFWNYLSTMLRFNLKDDLELH